MVKIKICGLILACLLKRGFLPVSGILASCSSITQSISPILRCIFCSPVKWFKPRRKFNTNAMTHEVNRFKQLKLKGNNFIFPETIQHYKGFNSLYQTLSGWGLADKSLVNICRSRVLNFMSYVVYDFCFKLAAGGSFLLLSPNITICFYKSALQFTNHLVFFSIILI